MSATVGSLSCSVSLITVNVMFLASSNVGWFIAVFSMFVYQ